MVRQEIKQAENLEDVFQEAVAHHQNSELDKACQLYKKILGLMPGSPLVNYNLGLALFELGKFTESYKCYEEALKQAPEEHDLLYNFALCAKKLGKYTEAVEAYGTILESYPNDQDSLYNLGCCLIDLGVDSKAITLFLKVLDISYNHTSALNNIACIYHRNGDYKNAKKYYTRLLEIQPEHKIALHLLASVQGDCSKNPPSQYIEQIFDNYSSRYEKNMVHDLKYSVPPTMRESFDRLYRPRKRSLKALDLGCGTGLSGEAFSDVCSILVGVDLSRNMIEQASQKEIYSSLYIDEITHYLTSCNELFDLIIAADVFIYKGDLLTLFRRLSEISCLNAHLCFSIEKSTTREYVLRRSGRFAHSLDYIKEVCLKSGWSLKEAQPTKVRKEKFEWIEGIICIAVKSR